MTAPQESHPSILLCTLNARFIHASLGLRYLLANLEELREQAELLEFTIKRPTDDIVAAILARLPPCTPGKEPIVGFGVYIWNVEESIRVLAALRQQRPDICLVLGGPEVSHETGQQAIAAWADFIITGWGDISFRMLCRDILAGTRPTGKIIPGQHVPLAGIVLPYAEYSDADLAHRVVYVEASRGCPFKCAFCLSALDKTAWAFDHERLLAALEILYARGARQFKFVDRTFNLNIGHALQILDFFLRHQQAGAANDKPPFLHFEVIPDHLPQALRHAIRQFPPGTLQLEVGIQTFTPAVQANIDRRQNEARSLDNLAWLLHQSHAHIHTDLIFGLPGETLESFAAGFDKLYRLGPQEIQLGLLKRLKGTPITRMTEAFGLQFSPAPPYSILQTADIDAPTMARVRQMARYWERIANTGRFPATLHYLLNLHAGGRSPFFTFLELSDWLAARHPEGSEETPEMLVDALFEYLSREAAPASIIPLLLADYTASGARSRPACLKPYLGYQPPRSPGAGQGLTQRQQRHADSPRNKQA